MVELTGLGPEEAARSLAEAGPPAPRSAPLCSAASALPLKEISSSCVNRGGLLRATSHCKREAGGGEAGKVLLSPFIPLFSPHSGLILSVGLLTGRPACFTSSPESFMNGTFPLQMEGVGGLGICSTTRC